MIKHYSQVYQFKITLKEISPRIWRRIQVPETYTFWDLSIAIQSAMDWGGHHLHEFRIFNQKTGVADDIGFPDEEYDRDVLSGWDTKIAAYFSMDNKRADYLYDFGDYWEHQILLEKILPKEPDGTYPCCIAGKKNSPPDDVGSTQGYEEFVEIMNNPDHEEHEEMAEWYGDDYYDPEEFDCTEVVFLNPDNMLRLMLRE
ncbi:plasmid pRiA4b ORF-3 family protein [Methanogenium sp. MK-MG]|uniref:plasmid pRiA4b ORF-3 family protein n=1 Tax=Methanogenium sp. MK-MG TaxID=2599926 RepID=UPI0013ED16E3|nr:plasmid pRiA4b ORF-3 family protein [Methanogenium sp. MK-MG]KAF1076929.1 hypothetical protein MKMG_01354 [Methanogenium sp. MK-MG]